MKFVISYYIVGTTYTNGIISQIARLKQIEVEV